MNTDILTETEQPASWEWIPYEDGVCITGYSSGEEHLKVPEAIENLPVRKIAAEALAYGFFLAVTLPGTLKYIDQKAFAFSTELKTIELPEGLLALDGSAFLSTQVQSLNLPDSLKELTRPESLDMYVYTAASHPTLFADGNGLYKKTESGGFELLSVYTDGETSYEILPETTSIAPGAFYNIHNPITLSFPESLEEIDSRAWTPLFAKNNRGRLRGIQIHPDNKIYFADANGIWKRAARKIPKQDADGIRKQDADGISLERWMGPDSADFTRNVRSLGPYSMTDRIFERVTLPVSCIVEHNALKSSVVRMLCLDYSGENSETQRIPSAGSKNNTDLCKEEILLPAGTENNTGVCKEEMLLPAGAVENNALLRKITASGTIDLFPYDEMLTEGYLTPERIRMILKRLKSPFLPELRKEKLRQRILSEGAKTAELLAKDTDTAAFEAWLNLEGHTSDTLRSAMEALFQCDKKQRAVANEMLASLQRKKSTLAEPDEFDLF